jgi:hypothetical protein
MPTSTFDNRMIGTNPKSVEKIYRILTSQKRDKPINKELFSPSERMRSEQILAQCLYHSKS